MWWEESSINHTSTRSQSRWRDRKRMERRMMEVKWQQGEGGREGGRQEVRIEKLKWLSRTLFPPPRSLPSSFILPLLPVIVQSLHLPVCVPAAESNRGQAQEGRTEDVKVNLMSCVFNENLNDKNKRKGSEVTSTCGVAATAATIMFNIRRRGGDGCTEGDVKRYELWRRTRGAWRGGEKGSLVSFWAGEMTQKSQDYKMDCQEKEVCSIGRRQRRRRRRRRRWRLQVFICYTEQCGSRDSGCAGVSIQSTWTRSRKKWCSRAHQQHYVSERRLINEHLLPREHKVIWRQTLQSCLPMKKNERAVRGRRVNVGKSPLNGTFRPKSECKIDFLLFIKNRPNGKPNWTCIN